MKIDNVNVRFSVYDPDRNRDYPLETVVFAGEQMDGFRKRKEDIKTYLEELIKELPDVNPESNVYIASVDIRLTIHKPPLPGLGHITVGLDDYYNPEEDGCVVKDENDKVVLDLSEEYDDLSWRDLNRIVDRIVKISA